MSEIVKQSMRFAAISGGALALAACGGEKPKANAEFKDGVRTQVFHYNGGFRLSTVIISECDGRTFTANTTDVGFHIKNGEKVYDVNTHFNSINNSPRCEDLVYTPEDLARPLTPAPISSTNPNA